MKNSFLNVKFFFSVTQHPECSGKGSQGLSVTQIVKMGKVIFRASGVFEKCLKTDRMDLPGVTAWPD